VGEGWGASSSLSPRERAGERPALRPTEALRPSGPLPLPPHPLAPARPPLPIRAS